MPLFGTSAVLVLPSRLSGEAAGRGLIVPDRKGESAAGPCGQAGDPRGDGDRRGVRQLEPDEHRVMVRGPIRVVGVEADDLPRRLEFEVVVERDRLVGIDVPLGDTGDLGRQRWTRQRVIEVARLALEDEGIALAFEVLIDRVDIARVAEDRDRILLRVRVHVANHDEVGIATPRGVGGEPVDDGLRRIRPGHVPEALAVALVTVGIGTGIGTRGRKRSIALRLQVVDQDAEAGPRRCGEGLQDGWPVQGIDKARIDAGIDDRVRSDGHDVGGLVDQPNANGISADNPGIDECPRARRRRVVQARHEVLDRPERRHRRCCRSQAPSGQPRLRRVL